MMPQALKTIGILRQKAYLSNQSDAPMRVKDCRALNPASQEN